MVTLQRLLKPLDLTTQQTVKQAQKQLTLAGFVLEQEIYKILNKEVE